MALDAAGGFTAFPSRHWYSPSPLLRPSLPGLDERGERLRTGSSEGLRQDAAHMQADVEPHRVGKLDRAHRHAELLGCAIDHCERNAFAGREHRLGQVGHQHAIDEEAGRTATAAAAACRCCG